MRIKKERRTGNGEAEFIGVLGEQSLQDRGFTGARWAGDDDGTEMTGS